MRAAVLEGERKLVIEEVSEPEPQTGEVVVRVEHVGICGSDLHFYSSGVAPSGLIMGHETAGVIADLGSGVVGWRRGDRVWLAGGADCGTCEHCLNGRHDLCQCSWPLLQHIYQFRHAAVASRS